MKNILEFMKGCENKRMSFREAYELAIVNFGMMKMKDFKTYAMKYRIIFNSSTDPDISDLNQEIKNFIIRKRKMDLFELRDEIIVNFEQNLKISKIKKVIKDYKTKNRLI